MRSYGDACGITRALDLIGERWAIPVVRELILGPRRYSDLAAALPGVSTNILGSRLKDLTETGIARKRRLGPPAAVTVYELTAWGAQLEPILIQLGAWAAHTPADLEEQAFSVTSFALSLRTTFDADVGSETDLHLWFLLGDEVLDARVERGTFRIERLLDADAASPHAPGHPTRIISDAKTVGAIVHAGADPAEAVSWGTLRVDGPADVLPAFARCFTLPAPPMEGHS